MHAKLLLGLETLHEYEELCLLLLTEATAKFLKCILNLHALSLHGLLASHQVLHDASKAFLYLEDTLLLFPEHCVLLDVYWRRASFYMGLEPSALFSDDY